MAKKNRPSVIIRRKRDGDHEAHHGGAWKIAYADFMTAMMAFFLVMWLLNATTDEQRRGIASYFNPLADEKSAAPPTKPIDTPPAPATSGSSFDRLVDEDRFDTTGPVPVPTHSHGASSPREDLPQTDQHRHTGYREAVAAIVPIGGPMTGAAKETGIIGSDAANAEQAALQNMAASIGKAVGANPEIATHNANLNISYGQNEVRIELHDTDNVPMFDLGSSVPNKAGRAMLDEIARCLLRCPSRSPLSDIQTRRPIMARSTTRCRTGPSLQCAPTERAKFWSGPAILTPGLSMSQVGQIALWRMRPILPQQPTDAW